MRRYAVAVVELVRREPLRTWAVVRSIGLTVLAFWPGLLEPAQMAALGALGTTLFGVDEAIRSQVTPNVKVIESVR